MNSNTPETEDEESKIVDDSSTSTEWIFGCGCWGAFFLVLGLIAKAVVNHNPIDPLVIVTVIGAFIVLIFIIFILGVLFAVCEWLLGIVFPGFSGLKLFFKLEGEFGSLPPQELPPLTLATGMVATFDGVYSGSGSGGNHFTVDLVEIDGRVDRPVGCCSCELRFPEHISPPDPYRSVPGGEIDWWTRYDIRFAGRVVELETLEKQEGFESANAQQWIIEVTGLIAVQGIPPMKVTFPMEWEWEWTDEVTQGYRPHPFWGVIEAFTFVFSLMLPFWVVFLGTILITSPGFVQRFGDGWGLHMGSAIVGVLLIFGFPVAMHRLQVHYKSPREGKFCPVGLGSEIIFEGVYVSHWQVPRFQLQAVEHNGVQKNATGNCWCALTLPEHIPPPWFHSSNYMRPLGWTRMEAIPFQMRFRGRALESGHFGYQGWCRWRIEVTEILLCEESHPKSPDGDK
jgi:hypothetical protein